MKPEAANSTMSTGSSHVGEPKKHSPRLPSLLVPRPALTAEITAGLARRLLLMIAPSGYGKSVGLAQAVTNGTVPVIWYAFDETDSSLVRMTDSVALRLGELVGLEPPHPLASDATAADCAMHIVRLVDRVTPEGVVLVLDGLDRSSSQDVFSPLIQSLLDAGRSTLHLVVTSTARPRVSLSSVARAGQLARIGQQSLAFSMEETGELLSMVWGVPVDEKLVAGVHRLTAGWPSGVSLVLLAFPLMPSWQRLMTDDRPIDPKTSLRDEVFACMDEQDRELILSLAFLPFVRPGTADDLFPARSLAHRARQLAEGSPAFWVVGRELYAMADSTRDELIDAAEKTLPAARIAALRSHAARLLELQGQFEHALHSYLKIGDMPAANRILTAAGTEQLLKWDAARLGSLATMLSSHDDLGLEANLVCARACHLRGDFRACDRYCAAGRELAGRPEDLLPFVVFQARSRSYLSDDDSAEALWQEVKALLSRTGGTCGWAYVWLASHLLRSNRIKEAEEELTQALPILRAAHDRSYLGWALNRLAHLQLKTGRYRALAATLREAREISKESGATQVMVNSYLYAALFWFSGQMEEAGASIADALQLAEATGAARWRSLLLLMSGEIALMRGDLETAGQRLEQAERLSSRISETRGVERSLLMSQARYSLAVGASKEASAKFEQALTLPAESQFGSLWDRLDVAVAFLDLGAVERAKTLIEAVVSLAEEMESYHATANGRLLLAYLQDREGDHEASRANLESVWDLARVRGYHFMPASSVAIVAWANRLAESSLPPDQRPEEVMLRGMTPPAGSVSDLLASVTCPLVRVVTLGALRVEHRGEDIPDEVWKGIKKAKVLLGLLLAQPSFRVTPDKAIDLLWPAATFKKGRGRLHWAVSSLRSALNTAGVKSDLDIEYQDPFYRLVLSDRVQIDHVVFEAKAEKGLSERRKGNEVAALRLLQDAIGHYGGAFLEDALYQRFAEVRRRQLSDLYAEALHAMASSGEIPLDMRLKWWQRALDHDPYDEEAYQGAAETSLALGLRRKAMDYLHSLRANLVDELDLPMPEWVRAIEARLEG